MAGRAERSNRQGRRAVGLAVVAGLAVAVIALLLVGTSRRSGAASEPTVGFSAGRACIVEGNSGTTTVRLTVTLSATSASRITVHTATANGSATTADGDFAAVNRTVELAPGTRSTTVDVAVNHAANGAGVVGARPHHVDDEGGKLRANRLVSRCVDVRNIIRNGGETPGLAADTRNPGRQR